MGIPVSPTFDSGAPFFFLLLTKFLTGVNHCNSLITFLFFLFLIREQIRSTAEKQENPRLLDDPHCLVLTHQQHLSAYPFLLLILQRSRSRGVGPSFHHSHRYLIRLTGSIFAAAEVESCSQQSSDLVAALYPITTHWATGLWAVIFDI